MADPTNLENLSKDLLAKLDNLFGLHAGFRPAHAKGLICSGTFTPSPEAKALTRAPHVQAPSTKVLLRYSNFGGIPTIGDTDPNAAPRGIAVRFDLAPHVHTDIIGHSHNGFPTRTGEEFAELLQALAASGPDAQKPTALDQFLDAHPKAKEFVTTPNPVPKSFATESFFAVTAFKFINKDNVSCFGRFQILPENGNEYLEPAIVAGKNSNFLFEEIDERLAAGTIKLRIVVEIAEEGDNIHDATFVLPANRKHIEFGTIELSARVPDSDIEAQRIIFDPIPRVDGIDPSDDPLIELRAALYLISGRRRRAAMK